MHIRLCLCRFQESSAFTTLQSFVENKITGFLPDAFRGSCSDTTGTKSSSGRLYHSPPKSPPKSFFHLPSYLLLIRGIIIIGYPRKPFQLMLLILIRHIGVQAVMFQEFRFMRPISACHRLCPNGLVLIHPSFIFRHVDFCRDKRIYQRNDSKPACFILLVRIQRNRVSFHLQKNDRGQNNEPAEKRRNPIVRKIVILDVLIFIKAVRPYAVYFPYASGREGAQQQQDNTLANKALHLKSPRNRVPKDRNHFAPTRKRTLLLNPLPHNISLPEECIYSATD